MIRRCDLAPQYLAYKAEIDAAIEEVLVSGRYVLAEQVARFEESFARYLGVRYAVGVGNATDGLTLALRAVGVGPGDEVITTPFTAIPTVSAIVDAGATPVFVDVCPDTFLLDCDEVAKVVTARTRAVVPVHLFGNVVDVRRLRALVGPALPIVEDAAQAHGSTIAGIANRLPAQAASSILRCKALFGTTRETADVSQANAWPNRSTAWSLLLPHAIAQRRWPMISRWETGWTAPAVIEPARPLASRRPEPG